ncbi:hypothetical protein L1279_001555 [Planomicrobium sp. HSC-17F08]|nr:hypothetical protein [Planomicrobium sp. HSC-17F08]
MHIPQYNRLKDMKNDLYIKGINEKPSCSSATAQQSATILAEGKVLAQEKTKDSTGNPVWYDNLIDVEKYVKSKRV